ncbi:hypothetical protein BCR34DRAFT_664241 [Clohesyomyces aquaticus]|uniref:Uncharacterized protein n=1 Tax=Clohesyomyces aquaticus TaxID=1231657 RepID=A0A1Y1ZN88_9PLEO|nr:hypothetical protein BCR34DRAFT_664241 [Clohesyomyces aquaticus]
MRVPLELLRFIIEYSEPICFVPELFRLRLANRLFADEILAVILNSGRLDRSFRASPESWTKCPALLQRKYLLHRIYTHDKNPCKFSTLFLRSLELQQKSRGISDDDIEARNDLIYNTVEALDLSLLSDRYIFGILLLSDEWGPWERTNWERRWDKHVTGSYSDVSQYIRLIRLMFHFHIHGYSHGYSDEDLAGYSCYMAMRCDILNMLLANPSLDASSTPAFANDVLGLAVSEIYPLGVVLDKEPCSGVQDLPLAHFMKCVAKAEDVAALCGIITHLQPGKRGWKRFARDSSLFNGWCDITLVEKKYSRCASDDFYQLVPKTMVKILKSGDEELFELFVDGLMHCGPTVGEIEQIFIDAEHLYAQRRSQRYHPDRGWKSPMEESICQAIDLFRSGTE